MTAGALRATPQNWFEHSFGLGNTVDTYPQDCATTPDGRLGAVRYANPSNVGNVVCIYRLTGAGAYAQPVLPTDPWQSSCFDTQTFGLQNNGLQHSLTSGFHRPSDAIEMTNEWCVSIGTGDSTGGTTPDETYIEAIHIGNPIPALVNQFVISPGANPSTDRAGFAHDLAITRDAKWAVINSENWIHLLRLDATTTPPSATYTGFNIGANPPGPCNPNGAVDSVAVTNERAVVVTSRPTATSSPLLGLNSTWVYIVDLTPTTGPALVLEHEIPTDPEWVATSNFDHDEPHDVAITPTRDGGGTLAVVTTNHSTAFYDLVNNVFISYDFERSFRRVYQRQLDSVELTGKTAVVIADRDITPPPTPQNPNPPPQTAWALKVYDLPLPQALPPTPYAVVANWQDSSPPAAPGSSAQDLAIDWDFDRGLVRTSTVNVVLDSLSAPAAVPNTINHLLTSPNGSDAYSFKEFGQQTGHLVFCSDSSVIGSEQEGRLYGVTIGARFDVLTSKFVGAVDIIDLLASPPVVTQVAIVPDATDARGCVPLDLAISLDQKDVVVRSADTRNQAPNNVVNFQHTNEPGPDLVRVPLAGGALTRFGGSGTVFGLDSLGAPSLFGFVNTTRRLLSISQDFAPGGPEYVHVAR